MNILIRAFAKFRKQATLNYKFRVTKGLCEYVHEKFDELVGGIPLRSLLKKDKDMDKDKAKVKAYASLKD